MKKFLVYRAYGDIVEGADSEFHLSEDGEELVAVELGESYFDVVQAIVDAINADLSELPESEGCSVYCRESGNSDNDCVAEFIGVIAPPFASENILKQYTVREQPTIGE